MDKMKKYFKLSQPCCVAFILYLLVGLYPHKAFTAESPVEDMQAAANAMQGAEKDFNQAEKDFNQAMQSNGAQKTGTLSWSDAAAPASTGNSVKPKSMTDPANPSLYGSPETGYAGTWTDSTTGDIITSVIAPTPPATQNTQNYPIIVEPNVGNWNSYEGGSGWSGGYPQWPVSPDNPGYGTYPPASPQPPYSPPPFTGNPGQNFYPSPPLPENFHPGYRPLRPQWSHNGQYPPPNPVPGVQPPQNNWGNWQPGWNGNPAFPNQGQNPSQGNWNNPGMTTPPNSNPGSFPAGGWNQGGNNPSPGQPNYRPGSQPAGGWQPGQVNPGFRPGAGGHGWGGGPGWGVAPRRGN